MAHPTTTDSAGSLGLDLGALRKISAGELLIRFGFGAGISLLAGLVGLAAGEKTGGMLLAFPAILPAALTLIEKREGASRAVSDVRGAAVGAVAIVLFAITVVYLTPRLPVILPLLLAALVWLAAAFGLYAAGRSAARLIGAEQYPPDVAASEAQPLVEALRRARLHVATAESCTGGALATVLTAVPRASECVRGGIVAYSDDIKRRLLDVPDSLLASEGPISEACARSMARGVQSRLDAEVGIAITGAIATPADGTEPGTVWVVASGPAGERSECVRSQNDPEGCRADALRAALRLAVETIPSTPQ